MADQMRLIIVSGLSGSGKSVALHVLEDLGYYCVDNLPTALLNAVVDEVQSGGDQAERFLAVGIDARNRRNDLDSLPELIADLQRRDIQTDMLFLQADNDVILKRYSETRRRHPLAEQGTALQSAISKERAMLGDIADAADLIIDTSRTSIYELAEAIRERIAKRSVDSLSVLIESFGFKNGIPADADFVFDLRCLPNPYWTMELRGLTGKDPEVREYLGRHALVNTMFEDILVFLQRWIPEYSELHRSYLTIAIGCTGGQHRSVYMVDMLAEALRKIHDPVLTRHNELGSHPIENQ